MYTYGDSVRPSPYVYNDIMSTYAYKMALSPYAD